MMLLSLLLYTSSAIFLSRLTILIIETKSGASTSMVKRLEFMNHPKTSNSLPGMDGCLLEWVSLAIPKIRILDDSNSYAS